MQTDTMQRDNDTLAKQETNDLISSEKVDGTVVYNKNGEKLGTIKHFMVGKRDGRVRYAVMSFGGLFGMGERYHPLPWNALTYDEREGGYVINLSKEQLEGGPSYDRAQEPSYDRDYENRIGSHYGLNR